MTKGQGRVIPSSARWRTVLTLAAALAAATSWTGANAAELACPRRGVEPVGQVYHTGDALAGFPLGLAAPFAPLGMLFDWLYSDDLARLPKVRAVFRAKDERGAPVKDALIAVIFDSPRRFLAQLPADGGEVTLPAGEYDVNVITRGPQPLWGTSRVTLKPKQRNTVTVAATNGFAAGRPAVLEGPVSAGGTIALNAFEGVFSAGTVEILRGDQRVSEVGFSGWPVAVVVPPVEGTLRLRITACAPTLAVADWPVTVGPSTLRLAAPDRVAAASEVDVTWTGDGAVGDLVGWRAVDTGAFPGGDYIVKRTDKHRAKLMAPFAAGRYEIVYRSMLGKTALASRPVEVTPSALKVATPATVRAGQPVSFSWPSGSGSRTALRVVSAAAPDGEPVAVFDAPGENRIIAPPGRYVLQLLEADTLRWTGALTVAPSQLLSQVPARLNPGEKLSFRLNGSAKIFDRFVLAPAGAASAESNALDSAMEFRGNVSFDAPLVAGEYDLVYTASDHATGNVELARHRIVVPAPDGRPRRLAAPDTTPLLGPTLLSWPEPEGHVVEIWCRDCRKGKAALMRRVEKVGYRQLGLPAGTYELRLRRKDDAASTPLATQELTVRGGRILGGIPETVAPGGEFAFTTDGTPEFFDRVVIVKRGRSPTGSETDFGDSATSRTVSAPAERGHYDFVYMGGYDTGEPRYELDRQPFTVR